jgi:hypothetical protein
VNRFEESIRRDARAAALGALNAAATWQEHPSYSSKTAVMEKLRGADDLLVLISRADGAFGARYVCGIDRAVLIEAIGAVRRFKRSDRPIGRELRDMAARMTPEPWNAPTRSG